MEKIKIPQNIINRVKKLEASSGLDKSLIRSSDVESGVDSDLLSELGDDFSRDKIKEKYRERYLAYRKLLRQVKSKEGKEESESEIEKIRTWIRALNNLDDYIEKHKVEGSVLKERQATVFEDIRDAFERGLTKGYVKLPTGMGKTVLFSQVIEAMGIRTLILVPGKALITQTGIRLEQFTDIEDIGEYSSIKKDLSGNVDIITYASFVSSIKNNKINSGDYDLFILDEAHRALGDETSQAIKKVDGVKIGFTATPEFNKKSVSDILPEAYHEMSIKEAVEEGLLSRFKCIIVKTSINLDEVPVVSGNYDQKLIEKAVNIKVRNKAAVRLYKESFADKRAIVYTTGLEHNRAMLKEFLEIGIKAEMVDQNTPDKGDDSREKIFERYKNGETMVLINTKVLVEGFDEDRAAVCININPTLSKVDAEQRAGRVLRLDKLDIEKWAYVIDFVDQSSSRPGITFSEIVGASELESIEPVETLTREGGGGGGGRRELPDINIEGMEIVYDTEKVLEIGQGNMKAREENAFEEAPEGWQTASSVADSVESHRAAILKYVQDLKLEYPNDFENYKTKGNVTQYFSPRIIDIIKNYFSELNKKAPEGWRTPKSLDKELKSSRETIIKYANTFKKEYPDKFKQYKTGAHIIEHYSPEIVEIVREHFLKLNEKAPEGWRTVNSMAVELKSSNNIINKYIQSLKVIYLDDFKSYKAVDYFSPKIVKTVRGYFLNINEISPQGWRTARSLSKELRSHEQTIIKYSNTLKHEYPNDFKNYKIHSQRAEHYSPRIIEMIVKYLSQLNQIAPEGWKTLGSLSKEFSCGSQSIYKYIIILKGKYPNDFVNYKARAGLAEYYSPEIVEMIREHFKDKRKGE